MARIEDILSCYLKIGQGRRDSKGEPGGWIGLNILQYFS
jgi:hypothetical protein